MVSGTSRELIPIFWFKSTDFWHDVTSMSNAYLSQQPADLKIMELQWKYCDIFHFKYLTLWWTPRSMNDGTSSSALDCSVNPENTFCSEFRIFAFSCNFKISECWHHSQRFIMRLFPSELTQRLLIGCSISALFNSSVPFASRKTRPTRLRRRSLRSMINVESHGGGECLAWYREKTELKRANDDLKVTEFNQELMLSN